MARTPLDTFRNVLDHLDELDPAHQLLFFRVFHSADREALPELAERVRKASAPRALCHLVYEVAFYYPWKDWLPVLSRMLRHESDLQSFGVGVRALGRLADPEAVESLKELVRIRAAPDFQHLVSEALAEADPEQAFQHHFGSLLKGSANPSLANEAAARLEGVVNGTHLPLLRGALRHPDLLVFGHAVKLVARVSTPEAAECLAEMLLECHQQVLEDRELRELLPEFRGLPRGEAVEKALAQLTPRLEGRGVSWAKGLRAPEGGVALELLERLKEEVQDSSEGFLTGILLASLDPNPTVLNKLPTQATEDVHQRSRRLAYAMDNGALGLAEMVRMGCSPAERVIALLEKALRGNTGREGLVRAFALILPAEATDLLDLLILHPDGAMRAIAVDTLGERREEALRPALLKACHDAITDTAHQALLHLGGLPGAEDLARGLLHAASLEEIHLGFRFIGMHRLAALGPELLEMLNEGTREEIAIGAIGALGQIGSLDFAPGLLERLHSGQSPQFMVALATALRDLGNRSTTLALCQKAHRLERVPLRLLAVEALAGLSQPLDPEAGEALLEQVLALWNDKDPWPLRQRLLQSLLDLRLASPEQGRSLSSLVQQTLGERRPPNALTPQDVAKGQALVKALACP